MEIVADWNQVARYAKGDIRTDIIDFYGYWGGNLTIMVPTNWSGRIEFINGSRSSRHSLMVTRAYAQTEMPVDLEVKDAIWGANTDPPEGIYTNERRQLDSVARRSGSYFLACARQTHLMDGHRTGREVRDGLRKAVGSFTTTSSHRSSPQGVRRSLESASLFHVWAVIMRRTLQLILLRSRFQGDCPCRAATYRVFSGLCHRMPG